MSETVQGALGQGEVSASHLQRTAAQTLRDGTNVVFISGASGAGKQETIKRLLALGGAPWWFSVSYTTRPPRDGEQDKIHYHFRDRERFRELVDANAFIEFAEVHGNLYGTPLHPIHKALDTGKLVIADIDVQGVVQIRKLFPRAAYFFLFVELTELEERLRRRGDVSEEDIDLRLSNAASELESSGFLYATESMIPSRTVLDEGKPTLRGIEAAADEILAKLCVHASANWKSTPAMQVLHERNGSAA